MGCRELENPIFATGSERAKGGEEKKEERREVVTMANRTIIKSTSDTHTHRGVVGPGTGSPGPPGFPRSAFHHDIRVRGSSVGPMGSRFDGFRCVCVCRGPPAPQATLSTYLGEVETPEPPLEHHVGLGRISW